MKPLLVVIGGPTGIGKTSVGIQLANALSSVIVSSDSRQVFKEMCIGTAVPSPEELNMAKHYMIQHKSVLDNYNASRYEEEVIELLDKLFQSHKIILLVGGSGLYIDAVCYGIDDLPSVPQEVRQKYKTILDKEGIEKLQEMVRIADPKYYKMVDVNNYKRLQKALEITELTGKPYSSHLKNTNKERSFNILRIALNMDREELYERINRRVNFMIDQGLEEEARSVQHLAHLPSLNTVGYKEWFRFFNGDITRDEAITQIKNHSRAYARRQLTWFRRYPDTRWFHPDDIEEMVQLIQTNANG